MRRERCGKSERKSEAQAESFFWREGNEGELIDQLNSTTLE